MPLSDPAPRKEVHQRDITCRGYQREDGLWDIEGHLIDTKSYSFSNRDRGELKSGEPVHEMWLRLTIDESMHIHAVEAATDAGPYRICPEITDRFASLAGLSIGPGWSREVRRRVGGVNGCTHLVELLRPIATTAFQTLVKKRRESGETSTKKPVYLDTCHALACNGVVVKEHWPQFYTGSSND